MNISRNASLMMFLVSYLYLWIRDTEWVTTWEDSVVILSGLPLFVMLGRPWLLKSCVRVNSQLCSLAVVSAVFAMAFDSAMMLVLIWTCFLAHWLSRNEPEMRTRWRELILLPVFGVPWLAGQDSAIGWYFRLSAAYVVECVFSVTGAEIKRSGTQLWIDGAGIDVEAACSGLGILQLLMIAGTVAMSLSSAAKLSSFTKLLLIFSTAWCSNTLRVLLISTMAVVVSSESADSWMHDGAGLLTAGFAFVGLLTLPWFYHPATACKAGA